MKYEGKPCKHCGKTERYCSNRHCTHCYKSSEINKRKPGYRNELERSRRAMGGKPTETTREFYIEAALKTHMTGIPHEVDHIVPLKHSHICGLHNEFNLQVLTDEDNRNKSNTYEIGQKPWLPSHPYLFV